MFTDFIYIVIGLTVLAWSADKLVHYAVSLANHLGVTPFFIGVVIIGFGTSAPEMLISALAALDDSGGLAVGNALGSNIANIGLVLGFAALFSPLVLSRKILRFDISVLFVITILTSYLLLDRHLSTIDGLILVSCLALFLIWSALSNMSEQVDDEIEDDKISLTKSSLWTVGSLILLLASSKLLLEGAIGVSEALGISELMIGLTVVAIGTSMPELAASIAAAKQKQTGLIIGNILGSNAFNTLGVLGIVGLLSDTEIQPEVLYRDFPMLYGTMILLTVLAVKRGKLGKPSGAILLISYLSYLGFLIYNAIS
jgi:cation:H+ antiporter